MGLFDGTPLERPVLCERCGQDVKLCKCESIAAMERPSEVDPAQQLLRLRVEKRKRGKQVTVVSGFSGSAAQRQEVLTMLKNQCGAGGTVDGENIEIQGSHTDRIRSHLEEMGYRVNA